MMLTLEAIASRAKARGLSIKWLDNGTTLIVQREGRRYAEWVDYGDYTECVWSSIPHAGRAELEGRSGGREGAARVLSVVAQVAALLQGQRLAWAGGASEVVHDVMDAVRVESAEAGATPSACRCGSVEWAIFEWGSFRCRGCGQALEVTS